MASDANIASQLKHNHEAMVQLDDELKRLQARRTQLEEQHQVTCDALEQYQPGYGSSEYAQSEFRMRTAAGAHDCVVGASLLRLLGSVMVSGIGTLFIVITLRIRRKRATATAARRLW